MNLVAAAAHLTLVAGFVYYSTSWRKPIQFFNAWCCAALLLAIGITRLILNPGPTILLRVSAVCEIGIWLMWITTHWGHSGLACWRRGHIWVTSIKTPTTILSWDSSDPSVDRRMRAGFYETLNSGGIITEPVCAVCDIPRPKDEQ